MVSSVKTLVIGLIIGFALSCIGLKEYFAYEYKGLLLELNATNEKAKQKQVLREQELQGVISALLEENHEKVLSLEATSNRNAALVAELGGLRDPGSTGAYRHESTNKSSGSSTCTAAGNRLSGEATEFLLALTKEADEVSQRLILCQKWAQSVSQR